MTENKNDKKKNPLVILVVLVVVAAAISVPFIWKGTKAPPKPLSLDEVQEALRQKTMALSYLEDADFELARPILNALIERLPREHFGYRNLAISGLQQLAALGKLQESGKTKTQRDEAKRKRQEAISWVRQAIDGLVKFDEESGIAQVLAARFNAQSATDVVSLEERDNRRQQRVDLLQQATKLAANNAAIWYELFDTIPAPLPGKQPNPLRRAAIQRAKELAPNNLRAQYSWARLLVAEQDQTVADSIPILRKLSANVLKSPELIATQLTKAEQAAQQDDWETVFGALEGALNLINGEELTKSDLTRIKLNDLEFLVFDFSKAFYELNPQPESKLDPAISVTLSASSKIPGRILAQQTADFDLDGQDDLVVLRDNALEILSRDAQGKLVSRYSTKLAGTWTGFVMADLNMTSSEVLGKIPPTQIVSIKGCATHNEALLDVVLFGPAGIQVLKHDVTPIKDGKSGAHTLTPVKQNHASVQNMNEVTAMVLADVDHDGLLDIVMATTAKENGTTFRIWVTLGELQYRAATIPAGQTGKNQRYTHLVAVDIDRDLDIDILASGPNLPATLLENERLSRFRAVSLSERFAELQKCDFVEVVEADGNASWDLVGAGPNGVTLVLTTNLLPGRLQKKQAISVSTKVLRNFILWDYDNDGFQDIFGASGNQWVTLRGKPGGFEGVKTLLDDRSAENAQGFVVDWDRDGDLDLVANLNGTGQIFSNEGGNKNHWISLRTYGQHDNKGRANHDGIGSLLELRAGKRYQARTVTSHTTHFGVGQTKQVEAIRILWTNGIPQVAILPENNQSICELMELKGSCPYLYTWNGSGWRFHTDLLWAAPIGLQAAEGKLMPSRPWEYLLIEGQHLKEKDGFYELRVTEELWEAAYFDQVRLLAVDHAPDIEVYSNEKVGPPSISQFHIHTVQQRRYPIAARNKHGEDVLPLIKKKDGRFYRGFDRRIRQGLTDTHFLELDLGKVDPQAKKITLFLTGWYYPTDTSLNVAISRNKSLPQIQPPSIWVVNKQGRWQKTVPFMGFPGGKTKTIAVDLTGVFLTANDRRLRIQCNNELFWDEAFFTVGEEQAAVQVTEAKLHSANLRYRGFSRLDRPDRNAPERFYYKEVDRNPKWPPMRGAFTRFGDVTELLQKQDGQLLVMASGDEAVLRFRIPPVERGKKRDFILHSVGWDKDADLNTIAGQRVEPLPFVGMQGYPPKPSALWQTPAYRRYLERYQTRTSYAPRFWKWLKNYRRN